MNKVQLLRHVDTSAYGSNLMFVGDVNGDGRAEVVFQQCCGMLAADIFKPGAGGPYGSNYTTPGDQALDCLTAVDLEGSVLWQRGEPWPHDYPFREHGGMTMCVVEDIDGDGRDELIRIRGDQLQVLDSSSGEVTARATLDSDGYSSLLTARFTRDGTRHIIVKPCSDGLDDHPYCCPVIAFDHALRQVWERHDFPQAGHTPICYDVDGDGLDELLIGSVCVNADTSIRWALPLAKTHADRRTICDVNGDGRMEQVLAFEAEGVVVSTLDGHLLWTHPVDHCGEACVGKFLADRPGLQIFANNENWRVDTNDAVASYMLDCDGRVIWRSELDRYAKPIDWPTAVGPQALLAKPHLADPDDARPFIMDGADTRLAEFDIPPRLAQHTDFDLPHDRKVWGDWGDYYDSAVVDLDGSGPKVLIWTRRDLWIFEAAVAP